MRPRLLLAAFALALPAAAAQDAPAPRRFPIFEAGDGIEPTEGQCDHRQADRLEQAIASALEKVESDLGPLNPTQAALIRRGIERDHYRFGCSANAGVHGGGTAFVRVGRDTKAQITMCTHGCVTRFSLAGRVLHELIHGVDPAHRLVSDDHNSMKPDVVYYCQFAVFREGLERDYAPVRQLNIWETANGPLEELADFPCDGPGIAPNSFECRTLRKYAKVCQSSRVPRASGSASR